MSFLLCVAVALFYSTIFVNGDCHQSSSPFHKSVNVSAAVGQLIYCIQMLLSTTIFAECPIAHDCKAWLEAGVKKSGIYPIKPDGDSAFQVKSIDH